MNPIQIGETAPDFTLRDQNDREVALSSLRGRKVLLSFHPLAWTGVCGDQMRSLEANRERLERLNTTALGLSIDHSSSKKAWAKELGIENTRLLSDFWPHGAVAAQYGLFREAHGSSARANVLIDEKGRVLFVKTYPANQVPDMDEIVGVLEGHKVAV